MQAGIKPANRLTVVPAHAADIEARARREGIAVVRGADPITFPGRPAAVILYLAPDADYARAVAEAEAPLLPPGNAQLPLAQELVFHVRLGRLLGFPPCCVDEFAVRLQRGITRRRNGREAHEDFVAAECAASRSQRFLGRLNDLLADRRMRIVTFYPCRYDCPVASEYATAVLAAAAECDRAAATQLRAALLGSMRIASDGTRAATTDMETLTVDFDVF